MLRGFFYQGTLWQKIQAAVSYSLVSCLQVLTIVKSASMHNYSVQYSLMRHSPTSC